MLTSFLRFRLAIMVRGSISTATFGSVASRNLIGSYSREAHVPFLTSSMKATAPTTRSWSSMVLDQKEEEKQIDESDKIAKADGMGDAEQVDRSKSRKEKFGDEEYLQRRWEEGRVREFFQEWKEAYERVYANAEEEEMRFKIFESSFKFVVETNSEGNSPDSLRVALNQFCDRTEDEMKEYTGAGVDLCEMEIKRSLLKYYDEERVSNILPQATMMGYDYFCELVKDSVIIFRAWKMMVLY
ncbi:uncharacterized protein LOC120010768 isoform X3 [Tripterygium wilfordii]|uniref:uncharacterized protein LOC120010768 isoform X3 n=2 Tax=Tripterygium wilfordii TaxID=458696 RepID=UPI0018F84C2F|nr:uncharacterized protein LOC120010768 isoform X3 [Tripterygium wilfordii]